MSHTDDDRVRRLLEDTVSDVEPRRGLDSIHARTARPARSGRPWLWGVGGAVVATAATVAAVAVLGGGPTTPTPDPDVADRTVAGGPSANAPSASAPADDPVAVSVYFVGDTELGPRLFREFHALGAGDRLVAAAQQAVDGAADDPDYTSVWPDGTTVDSVSLDGAGEDRAFEVRLGGAGLAARPDGVTAQQARLSVQQLVYTVQGASGTRAPVRFSLDGAAAPTVLGVPTGRPVTEEAADDVLAQVWVTDPEDGSTVPSPFTVNGVAAAFEANVQWELKSGETVVKRGFTTAEECCTMSPYSFTVHVPPGSYTLVVHDEDASGEHPGGLWRDTKEISVE